MNNHNALRSRIPLIISLALIVTGCQTHPWAKRFAQELATNNVADPLLTHLVSETPVIDVHTHNFNARDIPVQNIALGRRDALPPWTWLVGDETAKFLAAVIVADTEPERENER